MQVLVPLRVRIGRNGNTLVYPSFDNLDLTVREGLKWAELFDKYGGWHLDKRSWFNAVDDYNPDPQSAFGVVMVPPPFADAAVAAFPGACDVLDEAEFELFYNERAHVVEPSLHVHADTLNALRALYGGLTPTDEWKPEHKRALDPNDLTPGIVTNDRKTATGFLKKSGCVLCKQTIGKHRALKAKNPA